MRKQSIEPFAVLLLAGCAGRAALPESAQPHPAVPSATGFETTYVPVSVADPTPSPPSFLTTELTTTEGELTPLLVAEFEKAKRRQLRPVLEFGADWCPDCRAFDRCLDTPTMKAALRGTLLVKLNVDRWHDRFEPAGFTVRSIPSFYLIGPDGRPTGEMLNGDKWKKLTPETMAIELTKFLNP
jgi:thiol-disulfide isomerase/thioredoxin